MTGMIVVSRKFLAGLAMLLLCVAVGSPAEARGDRSSSRGGAVEQDVIDAVNITGRTVTIAGETYSVSDSSRLFDERGGRIRLHELRGSEETGEGDMVEFSLRRAESGKRREIRSLNVMPGNYE